MENGYANGSFGSLTAARPKILLAVASECKRFQDKQEAGAGLAALNTHLQQLAATDTVEIRGPGDVLLGENGLLQQKYRLTMTGLGQLCSALAPGLSQCVASVAGLREGDSQTGTNSPRAAIEMLNSLIRLRFASRLQGARLVLDVRNNRVEGIVGPRYQFFPNQDLVAACETFVAGSTAPVKFFYAVTAGRRMLLRYLLTKPLFQWEEEKFYAGWSFSNSEVGNGSIKTGFLLVRGCDRSASLFETGTLVHVRGQRFETKLARLFEELRPRVKEELRTRKMPELLAKLRQQLLGLGGVPASHTDQAKKLVGKLSRGELFRRTAAKILQHAIAKGSAPQQGLDLQGLTYDMLDESLTQKVAGRTCYDLYNALTFVAKSLQPEQQEVAEKLAYHILTNRYRLF